MGVSSKLTPQQETFLKILKACRNVELALELTDTPPFEYERWQAEENFAVLAKAALTVQVDIETVREVTSAVAGASQLGYERAVEMLLDETLPPAEKIKLIRLLWETAHVGEAELITTPDQNFQALAAFLMASKWFPQWEGEKAPQLPPQMQQQVDSLRRLLEKPPAIEVPLPEKLLEPAPVTRVVAHDPIRTWRELGIHLREVKQSTLTVLQKLCEQLVYLYEHQAVGDCILFSRSELTRHQGCGATSMSTSVRRLRNVGAIERTDKPREWRIPHLEWLKFIATDYPIAKLVATGEVDKATFQQAFYERYREDASQSIVDAGAEEKIREKEG